MPKLTQREFTLLDSFKDTKDKSITKIWTDTYLNIGNYSFLIENDDSLFSFINENEGWSFDDLLKLEVEEPIMKYRVEVDYYKPRFGEGCPYTEIIANTDEIPLPNLSQWEWEWNDKYYYTVRCIDNETGTEIWKRE